MSIATKILVVDDEPQIRKLLKSSFNSSEYKVVEAEDGQTAIRLAASENPDIILLDLGLPDMEGIEVTQQIREWSDVPIIVLTARGHEDDKVEALNAGADDYLVKPFSVKELMARINVHLRRSLGAAAADPIFEFGTCRIDLAARLVYRNNEELRVTPTEYKIIALLAKNADKVVTHRMILGEVWGHEYLEDVQYLRVHMKNLRQKIEENPASPECLLTEAGVGYRLLTVARPA